MRQHRVVAEELATRAGQGALVTAEGRALLTPPADAGRSLILSKPRAASIEYSRSPAHRLKSVDGSQSVLRGRLALGCRNAIAVYGQLLLRDLIRCRVSCY
jgi:hypothetical protein